MRDVHENKLDEVMDVEETQYLTISIDSTRFFLLFLPLFFCLMTFSYFTHMNIRYIRLFLYNDSTRFSYLL